MISPTRRIARSNVKAMPDVLRIEPIKARHLDDLDELFARGDPRHCQCAYLRMTGRDYDQAARPSTDPNTTRPSGEPSGAARRPA